MAKFLVHRHTAGRRHFDLRLVQDDLVRSWSMLKEPPTRKNEKRLAIEREQLTQGEIDHPMITEEAFGTGRARIWDKGEITLAIISPGHLAMTFAGEKLRGRYDLRRMRWYPGNRWMLEKSGADDSNLT
jgi:bifunctional non-homologous end joining protein LigD